MDATEFLKEKKVNPLTFVGTKRDGGYIELKNLLESFLREQPDNTKDLLDDIISWEKDLSEYGSLEGILRERYKIIKRIKEPVVVLTIEETMKRVQSCIDNKTQVIITGSYLFHDYPTTIKKFCGNDFYAEVYGSPDAYEITRIKEYKA
jgi:hypothetical protein